MTVFPDDWYESVFIKAAIIFDLVLLICLLVSYFREGVICMLLRTN